MIEIQEYNSDLFKFLVYIIHQNILFQASSPVNKRLDELEKNQLIIMQKIQEPKDSIDAKKKQSSRRWL